MTDDDRRRTVLRTPDPVLVTDLFAPDRAALLDADAAPSTTVHLRVTGEAGDDWTVRREDERWRLYLGVPADPAARVTLDQDTAWRLYTRGLAPADATRVALVGGERALAKRLLGAVAITA